MGCDVIDVGVGLAALFEGVERGIVPKSDVPPGLSEAGLSESVTTPRLRLETAVIAVDLLRQGLNGDLYPALYAVGNGPQALAQRYPAMQDILFTGGKKTLGNAGHSNALWTFLMPFSRFFSYYSGQIYKISETLPPNPDDEALRRVFRRVIERMLEREYMSILCNALSCCAFTFTMLTQDGKGEQLDDTDLLVRTLDAYDIHTTRDDLMWFAQAFWAQSIDLKTQYDWRPPSATDFPQRIYEGLTLVLAALLAPVINHALTGMPAAAILPGLMAELALFSLIVWWLVQKRPGMVGASLLAVIASKLAVWMAGLLLGSTVSVGLFLSGVLTALPGLLILFAVELLLRREC